MKKPFTRPRHVCGFSLIELITTLSVAIVLLAIGVPSLQTLTHSNQMTAAINTITTHLHLARSEAVTRGIRVVLCPSSDGMDCANTMIWNQDIILFTDNNKSGHLDTEEELLRHIDTNYGPILIKTTTGRRKAAYDANGFSMGMNVTFTFCDTDKVIDPKAVIVSNSGRPRISDTEYDGSSLDCS